MSWQPIETAPKNTEVLVRWNSNKGYQVLMLRGTRDWERWLDEQDNAFVIPSHWMSIPKYVRE